MGSDFISSCSLLIFLLYSLSVLTLSSGNRVNDLNNCLTVLRFTYYKQLNDQTFSLMKVFCDQFK